MESLSREKMFAFRFFVYISVVVFIDAKDVDREKIMTDCAVASGLTEEDFRKWMENQNDPTYEVMCFMKCCHEKDGSLNANGKWDMELLNDHLTEMYLINDTLKSQIMDCIIKLPPIQTCKDMKGANDCIPEVKFRNCTAEFDIQKKDFEDFNENSGDISEKMLCFFKCNCENDGMIYADGTLNLKFLTELIDRSRDIEKEKKLEIETCLSSVPPVKSCADFKPFADCISHLKLF